MVEYWQFQMVWSNGDVLYSLVLDMYQALYSVRQPFEGVLLPWFYRRGDRVLGEVTCPWLGS